MPASTLTRLVSAAAAVLALVACTGDDTAPATTADAATTEPQSTVGESTTSTSSSTTTTTTVPPPTAIRAVVEPTTDADPTASAAELLPAANGRGYLLIGSVQTQPGERTTTAMWESADAERWSAVPEQRPFAVGTSSGALAGAWHGTELAVGGWFEDGVGARQPAIWSATDSSTFGEPVDPFGQRGAVTELAVSAEGLLAAGNMRDGSGTVRPAVSLRGSNGWQPTVLPIGEWTDGGASGVAVSGSAVVVTGWVDTGDVLQAAAWASVDRGMTFSAADASALHSGLGSELGTVVATASGFVALACTASGPEPSTALATSSDGLAWMRVDIAATYSDGSPLALLGSDCSSLTANGDRLLVGLEYSGRAWVADLAADGTGRLLFAPRGFGRIAAEGPLTATRIDGAILAVSRESRGFSSGRASLDWDRPTGSGLPPGRPRTTGIGFATLADRLLLNVTRHPVVRDQAFGEGYEYGSKTSWVSRAADGSWIEAKRDDIPATAQFVVSANNVDVAFAFGTDTGDDDVAAGPLGGSVAWRRAAGESWSQLGLVTSGPGGEYVQDAIAVPGGFVAIGDASARHEDGSATAWPIALSSVDGATWTPELVPAPSDRTDASQLCPLPNGGALAIGRTLIDGATRLFMARRDPAGVWSAVDTAPFPAAVDGFGTCAVVGTTTVLVTTVDDRPVVFTTADAVTFESTTVDVPDALGAAINALVPDDDRLIGAGGVEGVDGNVDVALWVTSDGRVWERVEVAGFDEPDSQTASDAVMWNGSLVVAGFDRGAAVTWTLPVPIT